MAIFPTCDTRSRPAPHRRCRSRATLAPWLLTTLGLLTGLPGVARAELRDLVPEAVLHDLAAEVSGVAAKRNLDAITVQHRMRSGSEFDRATDHVLEQLRGYALDSVGVVEFPADGQTLIGTQKSRPLWEVDSAQLWELDADGESRQRRLADWGAMPLSLAQDSQSASVRADLVDVGAGTSESDYAGREVAGRLVLTSSQPEAVVPLAVARYGAAGIVSYAPNQRSAWWQEDDRLVRWGHLDSFSATPSFGFMISLGEARRLQQRLAAGEVVLLDARVSARHRRGTYRFATAALTGSKHPEEEVLYTCHLDHPRPGANDNASGCVAILEIARTLSALVARGALPRPARSLRFLWPAEIEGSILYLARHPDPQRIKANLHLDMVGGGPVTKAVFRIADSPASLPSFVGDLGFEVGRFVNAQTLDYADGEGSVFPLVSAEGGKEPLLAQLETWRLGSDHEVFSDTSWGIPGLYLHDWPDRYIHTNFDTAANIDPTKLKRAAFIGAVSGWFLANFGEGQVPAVLDLLQRNALVRAGGLLEQRAGLDARDAAAVTGVHFAIERARLDSVARFAPLTPAQGEAGRAWLQALAATLPALPAGPAAAGGPAGESAGRVYRRNPAIPGPMEGFGYSYLADHLPAERLERLALRQYREGEGLADLYCYEALNLVDGRRTVAEIRDWLTAELGPVPTGAVADYLAALAAIEVLLPVGAD